MFRHSYFRYSGKEQPSNDVHFLDFGDNEGPGDPNLVDQGEHPYFCALYVDFGTSFPFIGNQRLKPKAKKKEKKNKKKPSKDTGRIKAIYIVILFSPVHLHCNSSVRHGLNISDRWETW